MRAPVVDRKGGRERSVYPSADWLGFIPDPHSVPATQYVRAYFTVCPPSWDWLQWQTVRIGEFVLGEVRQPVPYGSFFYIVHGSDETQRAFSWHHAVEALARSRWDEFLSWCDQRHPWWTPRGHVCWWGKDGAA